MLSFFDRKDHAKCEFAVHDVFAVDVLISTGDGKTKEKDTRTTVFKRTDVIYQLKMKASRGTCTYFKISNFPASLEGTEVCMKYNSPIGPLHNCVT